MGHFFGQLKYNTFLACLKKYTTVYKLPIHRFLGSSQQLVLNQMNLFWAPEFVKPLVSSEHRLNPDAMGLVTLLNH